MKPEVGIAILSLIPVAAAALALYTFERWRRRAGSVRELSCMPSRSAVFVKNAEASTSIRSGELILSLPRQPEGLALSAVAARCWELIDGSTRLQAIARKIACEYGVSLETSLDEIRGFAARLQKGYYALEKDDWKLAHTHFSDLFAGARDEGVSELRIGDGMIVHVATEAKGRDGMLDTTPLRYPWIWRRRRAEAAFARHHDREAPEREAAKAFEEGWAYSVAGRLAEAEGSFRRASRLAPGWPNPHYQLGYVCLRARRYDEAFEQFSRTEQLSPGYYMVREYLDLGQKLADGRISFEAFHLFERATVAEPVDPDTVIALCRKALDLSPDFPSVRLVLGRAYARKREYERALAELRNAIDTDPDRSTLCNALYARGSIFRARGMEEQALREFEKVIQLNGSPVATRSAMVHLATTASVH